MVSSAEILAAFREVSNTKQLDRAELYALLQDGILAALAKKYGPNVQAEVTIDDGTMCDGSAPCKSGRYCDPITHVCTKQLQRNLACDTALACQDGLACLGLVGDTPGTCTDWGDVGSSCSSTGVSGCPRSQTCEGGICTAPSFVPYAAERCVTAPCAAGLGCSETQVCDWLHPRAGSCSGAASTLCEPGLVCSKYGDDLGVGPGVCTSTDVASCPAVTADAGL